MKRGTYRKHMGDIWGEGHMGDVCAMCGGRMGRGMDREHMQREMYRGGEHIGEGDIWDMDRETYRGCMGRGTYEGCVGNVWGTYGERDV